MAARLREGSSLAYRLRIENDDIGTLPNAYDSEVVETESPGREARHFVDRGFELKSSFPENPAEVIIFVEKSGPPFTVVGPLAGKPIINN